jgi:hypothetical protein
VSLSSDQLYVGTEGAAQVVNWRTGEISETDAISPGFAQINGGRSAEGGRIVEARTGDTLLENDTEDSYFSLSPDGRFAKLSSEDDVGSDFDVYDVASGAHVTIEGQSWSYGWSPDGELFRVQGHELTTCSPVSGECESSDLDLVKEPSDSSEGVVEKCDVNGKCQEVGPPPDYSGELKLGGLVYES